MTHGKDLAHGNTAMLGKGPLRTAKPPRTAKSPAHDNVSWHSKTAMRTATLARHGKGLCRVYMARRTAKIALPFATLPWALCRASTHGKGFTVRFLPFAVRAPRTATLLFPAVFKLLLVCYVVNICCLLFNNWFLLYGST
jgi:hypothetical protein